MSTAQKSKFGLVIGSPHISAGAFQKMPSYYIESMNIMLQPSTFIVLPVGFDCGFEI